MSGRDRDGLPIGGGLCLLLGQSLPLGTVRPSSDGFARAGRVPEFDNQRDCECDGGELLFIEASDLGVEASLERFDQFRLKDVVPAAPATVGGVTGLAISGGYPPAVAVVRGIPPGSDYVLAPNDRIRVVAVEVDTVTVTFIVEASDDDFDAFLPLADGVLQTVAFP